MGLLSRLLEGLENYQASQTPTNKVTQYPASLVPPQFNQFETIQSFSCAEVVDLISDGPIEGLVDKQGKKLYNENIFEAIFLNGTQIKESSTQQFADLDISSIRDCILNTTNNTQQFTSNFSVYIPPSARFRGNISLTFYTPDNSAFEFVKSLNQNSHSINEDGTAYQNIFPYDDPVEFSNLYSSILKTQNSSPNSFEKAFLIHIKIPEIFVPDPSFTIFNKDPKDKNTTKGKINDISSHFYYTISSENLNSFNYAELPKSFFYNNIKTPKNSTFSKGTNFLGEFSFYDINIYLWLIAEKSSNTWKFMNYSNILNKYLNKITFYQNSPSLYNYNLVDSEFKNGSEFQTPLNLIKNVEIDIDYNKTLIGPYKSCQNSLPIPRDFYSSGGVQRLLTGNSQWDVNVDLEKETSDDIRYSKVWPIEYDTNGKPYLLSNVLFNYSSFDKTSTFRACQDAVPITHYIENENVEQVYVTLNLLQLYDTAHTDYIPAVCNGNGGAGFATLSKSETTFCFYQNVGGIFDGVRGSTENTTYSYEALVTGTPPVGGYIVLTNIKNLILLSNIYQWPYSDRKINPSIPQDKYPNIWNIILPSVSKDYLELYNPIVLFGMNMDYIKSKDDWFVDSYKQILKIDALEYLLENFYFSSDYNGYHGGYDSIITYTSSYKYLIPILEKFLRRLENGKYIGSNQIIKFEFIKDLETKSPIWPGYVYLRDRNFSTKQLDYDIVIKYYVYSGSESLEYLLTSSIKHPDTKSYCFASSDANAPVESPQSYLTALRGISAGTKLPAILTVDIETGYELTDGQLVSNSSLCDYFAYRYNIIGIGYESSYIDLGKNMYSFAKGCQIKNTFYTDKLYNQNINPYLPTEPIVETKTNLWTIFNKCTNELTVIWDINKNLADFNLSFRELIEGWNGTTFYLNESNLPFPYNAKNNEIFEINKYSSRWAIQSFISSDSSVYLGYDGNKLINNTMFFRNNGVPLSSQNAGVSFLLVDYVPLINCITFCSSYNKEYLNPNFWGLKVNVASDRVYYTVPGLCFGDRKSAGVAKEVYVNFYADQYVDSAIVYYDKLKTNQSFPQILSNGVSTTIKIKTEKILSCDLILKNVEKILISENFVNSEQRLEEYNICPSLIQEFNNSNWVISYYKNLKFTNINTIQTLLYQQNQFDPTIKIPKPKRDQYGNVIKRYVKITKKSHETLSGLISKSVALSKVTEIIPQKFSYPFSAIVGFKIDSRAFGDIPTRTFHCKLKKILVPSNYFINDENESDIRYLNGNGSVQIYQGDWDGSFKMAWSNNPAWVMLDLLINKRYGLGNYISSDQVDIWELYKIARWCDGVDDYGYYYGVSDGYGGVEPRHTFNAVITQKFNIFDMINAVASIFRGHVYYMNSIITFDCDRIKLCIGEFNNNDVKDGLFNYTNLKKDEEYNAADIIFSDKRDNYKLKIEYVEDSNSIRQKGLLKKEINTLGITSRAQARRFGKYFLWQTSKETTNVSFTTDLKALLYKPGDLIKINDELNSSKNYGTVMQAFYENSSYKIVIDQLIDNPNKLVNGIHEKYFGKKITLYTPIAKAKYEDFAKKVEKFPPSITFNLKTSLMDNMKIVSSGCVYNYNGLYTIDYRKNSFENNFNNVDTYTYISNSTMSVNISYNSQYSMSNFNSFCGLGTDITISNENIDVVYQLKHIPNINMFCESSQLGHWEFKILNINSIYLNPLKDIRLLLDATEEDKYLYKNKYFFEKFKMGKLEIFNRDSNNYVAFMQCDNILNYSPGFYSRENLNLDYTYNAANLKTYNLFSHGYYTGIMDVSSSTPVADRGVLGLSENIFVENKNIQSISNTNLIQSDTPSINSYTIIAVETGAFKKETETCYCNAYNNEIICHQDFYQNYSIVTIQPDDSLKEKFFCLAGTSYSLSLRNKEDKIFKIIAIEEKFINEYDIFAMEYSLKKFEDIDDNYQIDNLKNTFNRLGYVDNLSQVNVEQKIDAPIINDLFITRVGEKAYPHFNLNWNIVANAISYNIYIKTPSRNTSNFLVKINANQNDFLAGIETSNTMRAFLRIPYYEGYLPSEAFIEAGTYTVSIQSVDVYQNFSNFSERSISVFDY